MADLWEDEGFGSGGPMPDEEADDWDEGEESLESSVEDGIDGRAGDEPGSSDDGGDG